MSLTCEHLLDVAPSRFVPAVVVCKAAYSAHEQIAAICIAIPAAPRCYSLLQRMRIMCIAARATGSQVAARARCPQRPFAPPHVTVACLLYDAGARCSFRGIAHPQ